MPRNPMTHIAHPARMQIHKIMAGLVDQHQLAGDTLALSMARDLADYFVDRIDSVLKAKGYAHWQVCSPMAVLRFSPGSSPVRM